MVTGSSVEIDQSKITKRCACGLVVYTADGEKFVARIAAFGYGITYLGLVTDPGVKCDGGIGCMLGKEVKI